MHPMYFTFVVSRLDPRRNLFRRLRSWWLFCFLDFGVRRRRCCLLGNRSQRDALILGALKSLLHLKQYNDDALVSLHQLIKRFARLQLTFSADFLSRDRTVFLTVRFALGPAVAFSFDDVDCCSSNKLSASAVIVKGEMHT